MAVRLVATDLDGTIVRTDGTISARTRRALRAAEAAGLLVVPVTGRPPRWMPEIAAATGHAGLAICANGALLYDLHTGTVVGQRLLEPTILIEVVHRLRVVLPGLRYAVDYGQDFAHEPEYQHGWDIGAEPILVAPTPALLDRPAAKLLARHAAIDSDALIELATGPLDGLVTVTSSASDGLLEMSAFGVTKASALADLAAAVGVSASDVIAFGDMPNDLAMLGWAGHAVAVANAHPAVLAVADEIAASNDEDGVAIVLERLLSAPVE